MTLLQKLLYCIPKSKSNLIYMLSYSLSLGRKSFYSCTGFHILSPLFFSSLSFSENQTHFKGACITSVSGCNFFFFPQSPMYTLSSEYRPSSTQAQCYIERTRWAGVGVGKVRDLGGVKHLIGVKGGWKMAGGSLDEVRLWAPGGRRFWRKRNSRRFWAHMWYG